MVVRESRKPIQFKLPLANSEFGPIVADGPIASDQPLVFMAASVYNMIKEQSRESDPREVGGALLGQYCEDEGTRFIIIPAAISCVVGAATPVSIDFPPEFWQQVEEEHAEKYPGLLRLGPYHSHPGYGVHPSSTDQATILQAFSRPHHISVIYDPREDRVGYTCWKDDDLMPPSGCFIYEHDSPEALVQELMDARLD
ncbi:MAG: Mov34/MPN/PAD-1 family protein [SAR202 cluster bacterium]|nr:Mov34/MPN/PAD-1 family protein [SAR202 cluster bacterium]